MTLKERLQRASDDLVGAAETQKAQGKELAKLRRELSDESTPQAKEVRRVLDYYNEAHPGANTSPDGARARLVRGALKLGHTNPPHPCPVCDVEKKARERDAVCTVADELIEALEGLRLMPFVGPHGRCAEGTPGARRYDDVKHALGDGKTGAASESTIERFRGYAAQAKASRVEKLHTVCVRTGLVHDAWAGLLLDALCANGHA